jgi:hypothetical protein
MKKLSPKLSLMDLISHHNKISFHISPRNNSRQGIQLAQEDIFISMTNNHRAPRLQFELTSIQIQMGMRKAACRKIDSNEKQELTPNPYHNLFRA